LSPNFRGGLVALLTTTTVTHYSRALSSSITPNVIFASSISRQTTASYSTRRNKLSLLTSSTGFVSYAKRSGSTTPAYSSLSSPSPSPSPSPSLQLIKRTIIPTGLGDTMVSSYTRSVLLRRRRSPRLQALAARISSTIPEPKVANNESEPKTTSPETIDATTASTSSSKRKKRIVPPKRKIFTSPTNNTATQPPNQKVPTPKKIKVTPIVPRTRETQIRSTNPNIQVMGIDEAGRGPLAGPVVAAAAILSQDIPGVADSKILTNEQHREEVYENIISFPGVRWAVAVVDAKRIDEINILQASLEAMRFAAQALVSPSSLLQGETIVTKASVELSGSYIICPQHIVNLKDPTVTTENSDGGNDTISNTEYYALIDGNRLPKNMPCDSEAIVKGDSKEFSIAAASILAKVTRDRLMHKYDILYPQYSLSRHKGYPTAAHRETVRECGASPIHRRTFAPLKHMTFDKDGNILTDSS